MGKRWEEWAFAATGLLEVALASNANAASNVVTLPNPISATSFTQVVGTINQVLLEIAIPLTAVMAIIGGFQMITSAGNPEAFSKGRRTLLYAAAGFAIVLLAGGVVAIVRNLLGA